MAKAQGIATMILTKNDGTMINLNSAVDSLESFVETKDLDFGDQRVVKSLDTLFVKLRDAPDIDNFSVIVKYRENPNDTLVTGQTSMAPTDLGPIFLRLQDSPIFRLRFQDLGVQSLWKLGGFEIYGETYGERF
jgi:hypothetical protein